MPDTQDMARHTNRDKLGRFARLVHEDEIRCENGGIVHTDAADVSHAYLHCNNIEGECTEHQIDSSERGWLCGSCVKVTVVPRFVDMPLAKTGTKVCSCCNVEMPVTKFDVIKVEGIRVREDKSLPCIRRDRAARKIPQIAAAIHEAEVRADMIARGWTDEEVSRILAQSLASIAA